MIIYHAHSNTNNLIFPYGFTFLFILQYILLHSFFPCSWMKAGSPITPALSAAPARQITSLSAKPGSVESKRSVVFRMVCWAVIPMVSPAWKQPQCQFHSSSSFIINIFSYGIVKMSQLTVATLMQTALVSWVHGEIQCKILRSFFHLQVKQHVKWSEIPIISLLMEWSTLLWEPAPTL